MSRHFRRIPPRASAHDPGSDVADRILSGTVKEQMGPEWSAVQDLVRALRATDDGGTGKENEREAVAAIAAIVQRGDPPKKYRSRILRGSVSPVVVAVGLFAGGAIAAAATGSLPAPIQRVASRVMSQVGIDIPAPSAAAHPESVPLRAPEPTTRCGPVVPRCLPVARHPTTRHSTVISPGKRAPASEHRPSRGSGAVKKKSGASHSGGAKAGGSHGSGAVKKKGGASHSGGTKAGGSHGSGAVKKKGGAGHSGGARAGVTHSGGKVHKRTSAGHAGGLKKKGGGAKTGGSHGSGGGKSTNPPSGGGGKSTNPPSGGGGKSTNPPSGGGGKKGS